MTGVQSKVLRDEMKFVFSPDIFPCGWLGSKHQLTNLFLLFTSEKTDAAAFWHDPTRCREVLPLIEQTYYTCKMNYFHIFNVRLCLWPPSILLYYLLFISIRSSLNLNVAYASSLAIKMYIVFWVVQIILKYFVMISYEKMTLKIIFPIHSKWLT